MENKINWNRKDYWNEFYMYDDYFLSFHFDKIYLDEDKWKELVENWNLNTKITKETSEIEDISIYNNNYSIVITGMNDNGIPHGGLMVTFSKNIDMETLIKFWTCFNTTLDQYEELNVREGIVGKYVGHPKEISKIMIDKL